VAGAAKAGGTPGGPASQEGGTATAGLKIQSWAKYKKQLRLNILPVIASVPVAELDTRTCEELIHGMYDKSTGAGYRKAALAKQTLQQVMQHAVRQGHRTHNPVTGVSPIPRPRSTPKALKPATIEAVHVAAIPLDVEPGVGGPRPTSRLADVLILLAGTGLRIGEALAIRWDDLDLDASPAILSVTGGLVEQEGMFFRSEVKTLSSVRKIQLPEWTTSMIRRRHESSNTKVGPVFPTRNGTYVRPSNFRTTLRRAVKAANVEERITPHAFRRTVATRVADGVSHQAAAEQLGHSSVAVTRAYYIEPRALVPDYSALLNGMAPGKAEGRGNRGES
jgi:integrase